MSHPHHESGLNRRTALGAGLTTLIAGLLPYRTACAQGLPPMALQRQFLDWSRVATGFPDLPPGTALTCLVWALRSGVTAEELSGLDPGTYRGTPLEQRLLDAWYNGLFAIGGSSEMRSYDTTLMWQAAGIDPAPASCGGTPDRWASVPSNI
jgi:hypothetical protein